MHIKPLQDNLLVTRLDTETTSKGGIFIPDSAQDKGHRAKVVAAGPGKLTAEGKQLPMTVKAGDVVLLGKWSGSELNLGGEKYLIVAESDVLAVEA